MAPDITDPRDLGGSFSGGDDPFGASNVLIDARHAILASHLDICKIDPEGGARGRDDVYAVIVGGRINQTQDTARVLFFGDLDWLASLITEAHGVAERDGKLAELQRLCQERWEKMPHGA
jgi:hypothetical protein